MSLTSHNLLTNSPSRSISFYFTKPHHLKNPNFTLSSSLPHSTYSQNFLVLKTRSPNRYTFRSFNTTLRAFDSDEEVDNRDRVNNFNLDVFLSLVEFICLASSVVIAIGFALRSAFSSSQKLGFLWLGNGVTVWQMMLLVGGVVAGAVIRWRQWRMVSNDISKPGVSGVNMVGRIEKLEEDLKSSATIIRVLSRQLEKLGIRFRVTRKGLKEPISETAALAQKNSEATRALAAQEDILEELGEIQKVLLAMQEQQQKQLDLILAIGKSGKLWEEKQEEPSNPPVDEVKRTAAIQVKTPKQVKASKQVKTLSMKEEENSDFGIGI